MKTKNKNIVMTVVLAALLFGLSVFCWIKRADDYSDSERRVLTAVPELTAEAVFSGEFMEEFESYTQDQFPFRDKFRSLKSLSAFYLFNNSDNNGIYMEDGYVSKLEYPLNEQMLDYAAGRFKFICDTYMSEKDVKLYFSVVPDKNYFMAEQNGYLSVDYKELVSKMREKTEYMEYIDITDLLSLEDYYRTDTHWRQEKIVDVAERLADKMGARISADYHENVLENPFYGVYCGQSALPLKPDVIKYLTSDTLGNCIVTSYDTGKPEPGTVYDMEAAFGKDPYEMFLCGADALITVENTKSSSDKELVVFRDSFASSLMPLMAEGYSKITLVDIRYVNSSMLGDLIEFENQDVLFIYSSMVLNNSLSLK